MNGPVAASGAATGGASAPSAGSVGKYLVIGFEELAGFKLTLTNEIVDPVKHFSRLKIAGEIPSRVHALDNREVALRGFMLPVKLEGGLVTEFILLRSRAACCYGVPPGINEWVNVQVKGRGVEVIRDQLISVYGTLHVTEIHGNNGFFLAGLYQLDGERIEKTNE
jgi:hypothetical protein